MSENPITIRNLGPEDAHILDRIRDGTFDNSIDPARAWAFLATRVNELVVALERGEVVGYASGTMMMHPDKPTAFYVNEISVHPDLRRQGIAKRLMERLRDLAMDRGCESLWLVTETMNEGARGLYRSLDGAESEGYVVFAWDQ